MSGYLRRLVDRHRLAPTVRLRAVSRFEGDHLGGLVVDGPGTVAGERGAQREPSRASTAVVADAVESPPRIVEPARPTTTASLERAASDATPMDRAGSPAPPPRPSHGDGRDALAASQRGVAAHAMRIPSPAADFHPPRIAAPTVQDRVLTRVRELLAPTAETKIRTRRDAASSVPATEPDVVHVHIGRVEVRAPTAPREPPRPPAAARGPAPLSLDQYLAGERRR